MSETYDRIVKTLNEELAETDQEDQADDEIVEVVVGVTNPGKSNPYKDHDDV